MDDTFAYPTRLTLEHFYKNSFKIYYDAFHALQTSEEICAKELMLEMSEERVYEDLKFESLIVYNAAFFQKESILRSYLEWRYTYFMSRKIDFEYIRTIYAQSIKSVEKYLFVAHAAEIRTVYEWMARQHDFYIQKTAEQKQEEPDALTLAMTEALLRGDVQRVEEIFEQNRQNYASCALFFDNLAAKCMHYVGYLWETNRISVAKEHLASATLELFFKKHTNDALYKPIEHSCKAVVATIGDELHISGAKVVAASFENLGFEVITLLDKNSIDELLEIVHQTKPSLIALSITMPSNLYLLQEIVQELRGKNSLFKGTIIVGGQALFIDAKPIQIKGVDLIANSIQAVEEFIKEIRQ